jgi:hypothetical protein
MRREEEEDDAKSRERRGGTAMESPMLGVVGRNSLLERGGGLRLAGIRNAGGTRGRR